MCIRDRSCPFSLTLQCHGKSLCKHHFSGKLYIYPSHDRESGVEENDNGEDVYKRQPIIRVYSEAATMEAADEIGQKIMDVVYSLAK